VKANAEKLLDRRMAEARVGRLMPEIGRAGYDDLERILLDDMKANGRRSVGNVEKSILPPLRAFFGGMRAREIGYAEVSGYGANCDAYHMTQPAPEGVGAAECMGLALEDGGIAAHEVGYINAHGTGTPFNDVAETQAVKRVFGEHAPRVAISSTKSMTGHSLGASGTIEAAYTALALSRGVLPPTINIDEPDPECDLDYVADGARRIQVEAALSNSFGFGGTNVTLGFRRYG